MIGAVSFAFLFYDSDIEAYQAFLASCHHY